MSPLALPVSDRQHGYAVPIAAPPDDISLVAAARGGDRASLDALLRRHYDRVYAVCRRVTGNDADAADAAQESMIAIVRGLPRFDGRSSFSTWAYRIATNASLDELRRRNRRPLVGLNDREGHRAELADPDAGKRTEALGDRLALDVALAELSDEFRLPVVLRDVGDLDYADIAEVLDIPIGTVKSRIARGRAALAISLGQTPRNQTNHTKRQNPAP
ncbi:MAG: sigma-70 family RNA polymerase sigma factor [Actinobacteria bacterium]|nr:sigma-70 family RNA polymerase sigma factor [Actinomycetota bacterium]